MSREKNQLTRYFQETRDGTGPVRSGLTVLGPYRSSKIQTGFISARYTGNRRWSTGSILVSIFSNWRNMSGRKIESWILGLKLSDVNRPERTGSHWHLRHYLRTEHGLIRTHSQGGSAESWNSMDSALYPLLILWVYHDGRNDL